MISELITETNKVWLWLIVGVSLPFLSLFLAVNGVTELVTVPIILSALPCLFIWQDKVGLFD